MCKVSKKIAMRGRNGGFTLLELAIVLIIIGIMTVPILALYKNYATAKLLTATSAALSETANSLGFYYSQNGAYPCPAGLNLPPSNTQYGKSDCTTALALAPGTCTPDQVCMAAGSAGGNVLIGAVPFVDTRMEGQYAIDGYGNRIIYAVSTEYVNTTTYPSATPQVEVLADGNTTLNAPGAIVNTVQAGILVSTGANGVGGYSYDGVAVRPCTGVTPDVENCDNDYVFYDWNYSNSTTPANYFDDVVNAQSWLGGDLWDYVPPPPGSPIPPPVAPTDIQNKNTGNVGIGVANPTNKLEVNGDVRANGKFKVQQVCDNAGNCFTPDVIGGPAGVAMGCLPGETMTGIAGASALCSSLTVTPLAGQTCPSGQYVNGVDAAGKIICAP